jgi:hypothetical protein
MTRPAEIHVSVPVPADAAPGPIPTLNRVDEAAATRRTPIYPPGERGNTKRYL